MNKEPENGDERAGHQGNGSGARNRVEGQRRTQREMCDGDGESEVGLRCRDSETERDRLRELSLVFLAAAGSRDWLLT